MRSYVTYDVVTGDIKGVANQIPVLEEDSLAYINVDYEVVEDILLGRKTTRLYCVTYNPALEVHEFRERTNFNANDLTINDLIYLTNFVLEVHFSSLNFFKLLFLKY